MIAIWKETKKLCNPEAKYTAVDGATHVRVPPELYEMIESDEPPADFSYDTYTVREDWEATQRPYVIYERKSDEQIAEIELAKAKQSRAATIEKITVTTAAGNTFDGHEKAQDRMNRAITGLKISGLPTITWVLADNSVIQATAEELGEALVLAGSAQTAEWVKPYVG